MSEPIHVDARGLRCPAPVIELAKAVDATEVGGQVELLADDPTAWIDVPVWCRMRRQRLVSKDEGDDGALVFVVEKTQH